MLRVMMNQADDIDAQHPPFFLEKMRPFQDGYGDLSDDDNYRHLIEDACRLVETNHVPWAVNLDREVIFERAPKRTVMSLYATLMDISAEFNQKHSWLCKASGNVHFLPEIEKYFGDDAYFLHLVRDGRDVMTSYVRAVVGEKTSYHIGKQWAEEQQLCVDLQQRTPKNRFLSIRYEDILDKPTDELQRICAWLNIEFKPSMLNFHESDEAVKTADKGQLWTNLTKPLMKDNKNKWERELSLEQITIFESVAKDMLDHFGYTSKVVNEQSPPFELSPDDIRYFNRLNNRMKQYVLSRIPARDLEIRAAQDELIRNLIRRMDNVDSLKFPIGSVVLPLWKNVMQEQGREVPNDYL